ncbi:MAG: fibronectin type III domain-containing protein [Bacteroidetes bacterium]|nr:fibronectin type III domain-containing protein [Bacteroidota bacterium]
MSRLVIISALVALVSCIQAQTIDPSFQAFITSKVGASGSILFSDGKYLVYGNFIRVNGENRTGVVKFNVDGTIDNTFNVGTGPNNSVLGGALQADGKILLGGMFTTFNGLDLAGLVRLNADGSVDTTFKANLTLANTSANYSIVVQSDGKIIVTGPFLAVEGVTLGIGIPFRLNANGSLDTTFTLLSSLTLTYDLAIQPDGKIIVAGGAKGITRLNLDGTIDATFDVGTGFNSTPYNVEVSSTGRIIACGFFTQFNGAAIPYIVGLSSTGTLDATFQANGKLNNAASKLYLQPDGKLLVLGFFNSFDVTSVKNLIRLNTDGSLDGTLNLGAGPGPNSSISFAISNSSSDIIVTGNFTTFNSQARNGLAVLSVSGSVKATSQALNLQGKTSGNHVKAQGADKILFSHNGNEIDGTASTGFERLNLDGTIDGTFSGNSKPNNHVSPIEIDHNGMILIGGSFTAYNGTAVGRIARLSSSGALDNSFVTNTGAGFDNTPNVIKEQPDGKILVGGTFTSFKGVLCKGLVRLNSDGTLDATFNSTNGFITSINFPQVHGISVQSDGKILVGGEFDSFDGHAVKSIIRLNADGSFDPTFLIGTGAVRAGSATSYVSAIATLSNGKILIGGSFDYVNGVSTSCLARLNSDGSLDNSISYDGLFLVGKIEPEGNGKFIVADNSKVFTQLNADGTIDNTLVQDQSPVASFYDLAYFGAYVIATSTSGISKVNLPIGAAPANLTGQAISSSQIALMWKDNTSDEAFFEILRSKSNNKNYSVVQILPQNTTSYVVAGLLPSTKYYYKVRASNSSVSNEVNVTTTPVEWSSAIPTTLPVEVMVSPLLSMERHTLVWGKTAREL